MSSDKPVTYRLTPNALADLDNIWRFSSEKWSIERADRYIDELEQVFELIGEIPTMAREYQEFTPPVRIHVFNTHLIVYMVDAGQVSILRLLGGRQDWLSILRAANN